MTEQVIEVDGAVARIAVKSAAQGNHVILVDAADLETVRVHRWLISRSGRTVYAVANVRTPDLRRTQVKMHKLLTGWPETDHRNLNGLDNRRENLRPASRSLNNANRPLQRNNTSGYKGVTWDRRENRWAVQLQHGGVNHHLGYYDDLVTAARSYDAEALARFGEFALCNFSERTA